MLGDCNRRPTKNVFKEGIRKTRCAEKISIGFPLGRLRQGKGEEKRTFLSPLSLFLGYKGKVQQPVERDDAELIQEVLRGNIEAFEPLVRKYQGRVFATARRYARFESEVEDIVQEVFIKAFQKLSDFRGDAPFEHWLMRLAVRTCYDHLRAHQRRREHTFTELSRDEQDWLEHFVRDPEETDIDVDAARTLVQKLLDMLPPEARLIITLRDIEGRSVKEIAEITGWSPALVKVRAFRARAAMRKLLQRIARDKYL